MTPEQTDALAAWWRGVLDERKATLTPGGPGWADVQARLAIVRQYEAARDETAEKGSVSPSYAAVRDALGWVMQRLAHAEHLEHPQRDGWIDSWRPGS